MNDKEARLILDELLDEKITREEAMEKLKQLIVKSFTDRICLEIFSERFIVNFRAKLEELNK